jgi:hypothetical protein
MTNRTTAHGARDKNQFMYRSYQLSTPANMDMFTTATVSLGSPFTKFKKIKLRTLTKSLFCFKSISKESGHEFDKLFLWPQWAFFG